jgi:hypothetical protein
MRKYIITSSTTSVQVHPLNDEALVYKWTRIKDSVNYKLQLSTKLLFGNNLKLNITDFDFLYSYESNSLTRCETLTIDIYKTCDGIELLEFSGIMPLNSGTWDLDKCIVTLEVKNNTSIYDCIEENKKETALPISQFMPYDNVPPNNYNPTFFLYDYPQTSTEWTFLTVNSLKTSIGPYTPRNNPYSGNPNDGDYPYILFAVLCDRVVRELLVKCGRADANIMIKSDYFDWNPVGDAIGYIGSPIPAPPTSLPAGNWPGIIAYNFRFMMLPITAGINYVTGQYNKLTHLLYMPKSNANDRTATEWEQPVFSPFGVDDVNGNRVSFADIEKIWAEMFQAYWFIDTDGAMRVEHISFFNNSANIYNSLSAENLKYNKANNKYAYQRETLPRKEIFKFSQNKDFLNGRIGLIYDVSNKYNEVLYDSICINKDKDNASTEVILPLVVTDIRSLDSKNSSEPDVYDRNGFFMCQASFSARYDLKPYFGGGFYIAETDATIEDELILSSSSIISYENAHVQWGNLIRRYLKDNRILQIGKNGPDNITFSARTRKSKIQENVYIKYCCNNIIFDPKQASVITGLGTGIVDEAEHNTKTGLIKIKALHD